MLLSTDFHLEFASLRVKTSEIGIAGLSLTQKISALAINALIFEPNNIFSWKALEDLNIHFFLIRENEQTFKLTAKSQGIFTCNCVNCLESLTYDLNLDFSMRLILGNENEDLSTDISFSNQELDDFRPEIMVSYFISDTIDLGLLLREQIFMIIPDYPKCTDQRKETFSKSACQTELIRASEQGSNLRENPFVKHFKNSILKEKKDMENKNASS